MLNKLSLVPMLIYASWITIKLILYVLSKRWGIFWLNIMSRSRIMLALLYNSSSKKGPFSPLARNAANSINWALKLLSLSPLYIQLSWRSRSSQERSYDFAKERVRGIGQSRAEGAALLQNFRTTHYRLYIRLYIRLWATHWPLKL